MEFVTKVTTQIPGTVSEQLKADPAQQIATPEPINTGIAGTRDAFEIATPQNNLLEMPAPKTDPPKTQATPTDNKVAQLKERLKSLIDERNELNSQIKALRDEILQAQQARDIPRLKAAEAKLKDLSAQLDNVEEEMRSILNELESIDQNKEQPQDPENQIKESLLVKDSASLNEYFWNRMNRELLNPPQSFISSDPDRD